MIRNAGRSLLIAREASSVLPDMVTVEEPLLWNLMFIIQTHGPSTSLSDILSRPFG